MSGLIVSFYLIGTLNWIVAVPIALGIMNGYSDIAKEATYLSLLSIKNQNGFDEVHMRWLRAMDKGILLWNPATEEAVFVTWPNVISIRDKYDWSSCSVGPTANQPGGTACHPSTATRAEHPAGRAGDGAPPAHAQICAASPGAVSASRPAISAGGIVSASARSYVPQPRARPRGPLAAIPVAPRHGGPIKRGVRRRPARRAPARTP
jgi:hypothetical protein